MTSPRAAFVEALAPGARKAYVDEYESLPALYPQLFNIETTARAYEDDLMFTGLPVAVTKSEGEDVAMDRPKYRGKVRYIVGTFGLGYEVTREAQEDELHAVIAKPSSRYLARSMREAEEISAWGVMNNSFSSIMAYDGVALVSTAHPGVGALTQANRPAADTDLSVAALQASFERQRLLKTDRGLRVNTMPAILLTAVQGFWLARELLGSEFKPYTQNNEINVLREIGLQPMDSPYLTDDDAWWTVAPKGVHTLNWFWRRQPIMEDGYEQRPQITFFMVTARWSCGVTDWHGIDGSPGA